MKKLMIAAAVAMFGIAANAAVASWMVGFINEATDEGGWGTTALNTTVGYDVVLSIYSDEAMSTLVTTSSASEWTDGIAMAETGDVLVNSSETTYYGKILVTHGEQTLESQNFQFTTSTMDDYSYLTIATDPTTVDGVYKIGGADFSGDTYGAFTSTGWTAAPEPTSGLLMLLGMAGLALRRRRA